MFKRLFDLFIELTKKLQFSNCAKIFRDMVNWAKTCIILNLPLISSFFFSPMTVLLNLSLNISYKERRSQKIRQI